MYLVNFVAIWGIKVNIGFFLVISSHLELNCVTYKYICFLWRPSTLRLISTTWIRRDFLPEVHGTLDTRIPTYCISVDTYPRLFKTKFFVITYLGWGALKILQIAMMKQGRIEGSDSFYNGPQQTKSFFKIYLVAV